VTLERSWRIAWYNYAVGVLRTKGYTDTEIEGWFDRNSDTDARQIPVLADQEPFVRTQSQAPESQD
jgi:hypothetical protein